MRSLGLSPVFGAWRPFVSASTARIWFAPTRRGHAVLIIRGRHVRRLDAEAGHATGWHEIDSV